MKVEFCIIFWIREKQQCKLTKKNFSVIFLCNISSVSLLQSHFSISQITEDRSLCIFPGSWLCGKVLKRFRRWITILSNPPKVCIQLQSEAIQTNIYDSPEQTLGDMKKTKAICNKHVLMENETKLVALPIFKGMWCACSVHCPSSYSEHIPKWNDKRWWILIVQEHSCIEGQCAAIDFETYPTAFFFQICPLTQPSEPWEADIPPCKLHPGID